MMKFKFLLLTLLLLLSGAGFSFGQASPTPQDIVLYASSSTARAGYQLTADATAAGGNKLHDPNASQSQGTPLASPAVYFDLTFQATANVPYRLWMRMRADSDSTSSDAVWVQFTNTVDLAGNAVFRINSATATSVILQDDGGNNPVRTVQGWGWADNGFGAQIAGPAILFNTTGPQTIRVQRREDGVSIDQIVLSPSRNSFLYASPGAMKNDTRILSAQSPSAPSASVFTENKLYILEYNIHHCYPTSQVYSPDRTASVIAMSGANIVGLNEVLTGGSNQDNIIKTALELKTGQQWHMHYAPGYSGATEGNLVLSKFPFVANSAATHFLGNSRSMGRVQVLVNSTPVNFMVTHLDQPSATVRAAQINNMLSAISTFNYAPPNVIVGDFNCQYSASELTPVKNLYWDAWLNAVVAVPTIATAYADNPANSSTRTRGTRIDFIWYSKAGTDLTLEAAKVPDTRDINTYQTDPSGPTNSIGDLLAIGIDMDSGMIMNTHDDKGIRPSDHNQLMSTFAVAGSPPPPTGLIAYDGFNYTGNLNTQNGGSGFGNAWTAVSGLGNMALSTGSLTYSTGSNELTVSGNKLAPAISCQSTRNFASPIVTANSTKWVSFRVKYNGGGALPTNHLGFTLNPQLAGAGTSIFLGKPGNATNWGADANGSSQQKALPFTQPDAFLLYKLVFASGNVTVSMWVNPSLTAGEAGLGASQLSAPCTAAHTTDILSMKVSSGANSSNYQLDEFRIGNNYTDVIPSSAVEVIVDNPVATLVGTWTTSTWTGGGIPYGGNYFHDGNPAAPKANKTCTWTPTIPYTGSYQVYVQWSSNTDRTSAAPYVVNHAGGLTTPIVKDQRTLGGTWQSLGQWTFNAGTVGYVQLSTAGTTGYVTADAVRFVKQP